MEFDVTVKGVALEDSGLTEWNSISGLGLVTNGLIWDCNNIWSRCLFSDGATTVSWTLSTYGFTTTTWTLSSYGMTTTSWSLFTTYGIEECT